jgi:hypothetical protein
MCDDEVGVLVQVKMNFVELEQKMLSKHETLLFHEMVFKHEICKKPLLPPLPKVGKRFHNEHR